MKLIVENWRQKLYKDISSYMLLFGAVLPDLVNLILENWSDVSSFLGLSGIDDGYKSGIRLTFIVLAFMSKFVKQYKTSDEVVAEKIKSIYEADTARQELEDEERSK